MQDDDEGAYLGPRFDKGWYAVRYRHQLGSNASPFEHYRHSGRLAGCKPNSAVIECIRARDPFSFTPDDLRNEMDLIEDAGVFDCAWYSMQYEMAEQDCLRHYLIEGAYEGLDPSPFFSSSSYYRANFEIAQAGTNALWHYILFGFKERRSAGLHARMVAALDFDESVWMRGL